MNFVEIAQEFKNQLDRLDPLLDVEKITTTYTPIEGIEASSVKFYGYGQNHEFTLSWFANYGDIVYAIDIFEKMCIKEIVGDHVLRLAAVLLKEFSMGAIQRNFLSANMRSQLELETPPEILSYFERKMGEPVCSAKYYQLAMLLSFELNILL